MSISLIDIAEVVLFIEVSGGDLAEAFRKLRSNDYDDARQREVFGRFYTALKEKWEAKRKEPFPVRDRDLFRLIQEHRESFCRSC